MIARKYMNEQSIQGKVAIVTGAGRGLGAQIAKDLAAAGASVGLVARTESQLAEVAAQINKKGARALVLPLNVTDRAAIERAVEETSKTLGPVSILVNNAGVNGPFGPIGTVDPDTWWNTQDIHVRGALLFMHALIPDMKRRKDGRIINMSSIGAHFTMPGASSYSISKATLVQLTEHVHIEIKHAGLAAFVIHPGTIITAMAHHSMNDPDALRWAGYLAEHLSQFVDQDQTPALERLGSQVLALASGRYDMLAGRYLDLERELVDLAEEEPASQKPVMPWSPSPETPAPNAEAEV
jgi:NAD(P)-dependent dehydrogenase (short-subunit alcohol dehydrogenase family)